MNSEQYLRALKIKHSNKLMDDKKIVKYDEKDEILDTILDFLEEAIAINQTKKENNKIQGIRIAAGNVYILNKRCLDLVFLTSWYKLNYLRGKIESYNYTKLKEALLDNIEDFKKIGYGIKFLSCNIFIIF